MRVPVRIVYDDGISRRKIDTESAGSRGEEENKFLRSLLVEPNKIHFAFFAFH